MVFVAALCHEIALTLHSCESLFFFFWSLAIQPFFAGLPALHYVMTRSLPAVANTVLPCCLLQASRIQGFPLCSVPTNRANYWETGGSPAKVRVSPFGNGVKPTSTPVDIRLNSGMTYYDAKHNTRCHGYHAAKARLRGIGGALHGWVICDTDYEMFSL